MSYLDPLIQQRIDKKLKRLNMFRPLSSSAVKKLQEQFKIEMIYNSNAIEGNSLSLKETFLVINEGITIKNKPLRDHLEATNHYEALEYLYSFAQKNQPQTISEITIRNLHRLVTLDTEKEWAGRYRNGGVIIVGAQHKPPEAIAVSHLMTDLIKWFRQNYQKLHPVELAALLHHRLVYVHPFFDGNGRTARLVMNLFLLSKGYPLVIILKIDRRKYYQTLNSADRGNYQPFVNFIAQAVERTLDIYLKTLGPPAKSVDKFLPLSVISKNTPYSPKYLNLLARKGKIEAHKEEQKWLTTIVAIKDYQKNRQRKRIVKNSRN
ncbi:Fic family protein [Candidatus Gottesmanbacteria bacterium]|nr:Fic family protein [Candidatus Gottesmanbacteria bacterium]MBI5465381.1 Fic family protein [Candidatus Gottesmanbacteria bacterium]